jgi:hypothetical protein
VRGICDPGRGHVRTVPELDRLGEPRAMGLEGTLNICSVPEVGFGHGVRFGQWCRSAHYFVFRNKLRWGAGLEPRARTNCELRNYWPPIPPVAILPASKLLYTCKPTNGTLEGQIVNIGGSIMRPVHMGTLRNEVIL